MDAQTKRFMERLQQLLVDVHHNPGRIKSDPEMVEIIFSLYGTTDHDRVLTEVVEPYLEENTTALRTIWSEHADDPSWELLDRPEVLLIFERADHDREKLRQVWPGPDSWLSRISSVWGVPL
jgi:hypothetical protein